jgi:hypothetical protein
VLSFDETLDYIFYMQKRTSEMFSRVGKMSLTKFKITMERKEILSKEYRYIKPSRSEIFHEKVPIEQINKLVEQANCKPNDPIKEEPKMNPCHSSAFCGRSRETLYGKWIQKQDTPAPGTYNLSYDLIDKHILSPSYKKPYRIVKLKKTEEEIPEILKIHSSEPIKFKKINGLVCFDKQIPRSKY